MKRNDLLFGIGLSVACYLIAPDVFDKLETVCFQIGMAILGAYTSKFIREAWEEVIEYRERLRISKRRERVEKRINFPHVKRYYILPAERVD